MSGKEKLVMAAQLAGVAVAASALFTKDAAKKHRRLVTGGILFVGGLAFQYGMGKTFTVGKK